MTGVDASLLEHIYPADSNILDVGDSCSNAFFTSGTTSQQHLLDLLPSMTLCDALKTVFCNVFSPLFHILHDPSFDVLYQSFRASPEHAPLSSLALIFVVIAIATTALSEDDPLLRELGHDTNTSAKVRRLTAKYQSAALRCLATDNFMWRHTLATLQSLILLIYSFSHTRGPSWSLLGATFNIAVALGCHVDPVRLEGLSVVESEERRRCWAGLMLLYTIQNTCLGHVAPVIVTASVQLPADIEDEDLVTLALHSPPNEAQTPRPSKMAYILHKFKLYQLAAEICQLPPPSAGASAASSLDAIHFRIASQQSEQRAHFANVHSLPVYHQAHHRILRIYTNHLFILLHRPYLHSAAVRTTESASYPSATSPQPPLTAQTSRSLHQILESAMIILRNYLVLAAGPDFAPYRWYVHGVGAFHALLAAAALIVAASDSRAALGSALLPQQEFRSWGMACSGGRKGRRRKT
ncbi:uncharacterized protein AB675_9489 [Cyphellophora attinorum]|uniref:Xylanolytic transcriptional activator regulatory domain-containing protein n=1 Tax=Cyphellophora attinorum TaxID=1664694 RepID=A0A0N1NZT9_9EURO|nr:uncharacterized protein AB675_9489 [Phialophora attinorum]KPI42473.1 hypothetical protein AB675_9489 [Phialophora attinorum]